MSALDFFGFGSMGTQKIPQRKKSRRRERSSGCMPPSNKQNRAVEKREQVIEEYIASLRNFMKSISRKWN
jgi:hypothetical protein